MKLDKAIQDTVEAEVELAKQLRVVGERHAVEHDLYHLGHTLARQCAGHVEQLPFAARYGASGPSGAVSESPGILEGFGTRVQSSWGAARRPGCSSCETYATCTSPPRKPRSPG